MGVQVQAHSTKNAVLFVWVTAPMLYYATDPDLGPDPFRVVAAWGFEPKTGAVWDKVKHNFGHYFSIRHEHLLVATRGSCAPDRQVPMQDSVVTERRSDVHSEKPEIFRTIIEHLYDGPYVELFARSKRKGWTTWGNQINGALIERAG
jgi:N6-adenosine-specific RNA methylase IME4